VVAVRLKKTTRTCITLEEEILEKIDRARGLITRSAWINDKLKRILGGA